MGDDSEVAIRAARDHGDMQEVVRLALDVYKVEIYSFLCARLGAESDAHEVFSQVSEDLWRGIDGFARSEDPHEVQVAIELALRRHSQEAQLTEQVSQLETALERRSMIERAKGILMERHAVDDRAAFAMLRDHARNRGRKVVDVAASVVEGHPLLPRRRDTD